MSALLATIGVMHLVCSGHVRLGFEDGFLNFRDGAWEREDLSLVVGPQAVAGFPTPEGYELGEVEQLAPLEDEEFRLRVNIARWKTRPASLILRVFREADGVRQIVWSGAELVHASHARTITKGNFACVEDKHAEDRKS